MMEEVSKAELNFRREQVDMLQSRIAELEAAINRAIELLTYDENASPYIDQSLAVLLQALVGDARKPGVTTTT